MANRTRIISDSLYNTNIESKKVFSPQLIWPTFISIGDKNYESDQFVFQKSREDVRRQNTCFLNIKNNPPEPLPGSNTFWMCFRMSRDILLVDRYFREGFYTRMLGEMCEAYGAKDRKEKYIQILCDKFFDDVNSAHIVAKRRNKKMFQFFRVVVRKLRDFSMVHDRFAIMDHEIWHCGAAVGGMYGGLSALSRGWKDEGDCLKKYFCGEDE